MRGLILLALLAGPALPALVELKPYDPVDTSSGKLVRREVVGEQEPLRLILNGEQVVYQRDGSLELAYLIPQADAAGNDAVLITVGSDVPAEKSCAHLVFVTLPKEGKGEATPEFGDCTDQFRIDRKGNAVVVEFTAHGASWTYQDGKLVPNAPPKKAPSKAKAKSHPAH